MISRILIKDAIVFDKVVIEPNRGLNIFSGPSGAGKSVLVSSMLSVFGYNDPNAALAESNIDNIRSENELVEEENIVKCIKKEKSRYFLNDSQVSKKALKDILLDSVRFLNHKDTKDINPESILELVDLSIKDSKFTSLFNNYQEEFLSYKDLKKELDELISNRAEIEQKREFTLFEVEKIRSIAPKKDEYEELLDIKKRLSRKEKIEEAIERANMIFDYESDVTNALELSSEESDFFSEAMNELRGKLENSFEKLDELREIDADNLLDRIEKVSSLVKRYGSEEEALVYLEEKSKDLDNFENFDSLVEEKTKRAEEVLASLVKKAEEISGFRKKSKVKVEKEINHYLKDLKLSSLTIELKKCELNERGMDEGSISLKGVDLSKVSSGEFNRLRLSLLATKVNFDGNPSGVLFLDEIDANVSGEESEAIANVVKLLSSKYQIFAISHQPQLSSKADAHFLVEKKQDKSSVSLLDKSARIKEIARMISGKEITEDAKRHAENLLL